MSAFASFDQEELKLVYRTLHAHLVEHLDLMDTNYFTDLQRWLHAQAKLEGVDVTHHAAWDRWLGAEVIPCAMRVAGRSTLRLVEDPPQG